MPFRVRVADETFHGHGQSDREGRGIPQNVHNLNQSITVDETILRGLLSHMPDCHKCDIERSSFVED